MRRRGLECFPPFLFLLFFQDAILMTYAHQQPDYQQEFRYGEPTIFVIKRVKNQTSGEEHSHRMKSWAPPSRFEPYYRTEFAVLILLVLSCLILFTIFGNALVVVAVLFERSLQVRLSTLPHSRALNHFVPIFCMLSQSRYKLYIEWGRSFGFQIKNKRLCSKRKEEFPQD